MYSRTIAHCLIPPSYLPLLIIECKMPILFLIYPMYLHRRYHAPFIYILEPKTCSQQRPSWLSWQSVALDSRVRELDPHRKPWSCIFRNWRSRLSLRKKIYTLAKYPYYLPLLVIECNGCNIVVYIILAVFLADFNININRICKLENYTCMHVFLIVCNSQGITGNRQKSV